MHAHRMHARLNRDGSLTLEGLPFEAGDAVEVIVLAEPEPSASPRERYPLRGAPLRYDRPTEPVAEGDWDAAR